MYRDPSSRPRCQKFRGYTAERPYHWKYKTDIVKVMSDYPYPKPEGNWYELKVLDSPFPDQIRALELIRDGLHGDAYILETAFNPWQVAVKLSSKEEVVRLQQENPQRLLDALDVLTQSHINHAKRAFAAGAWGFSFRLRTPTARNSHRQTTPNSARPLTSVSLQRSPAPG
jgi:hypothetical protein